MGDVHLDGRYITLGCACEVLRSHSLAVVPMSSSQSTHSPQLKLVLDWGEAFKSRDKDQIAKYLHKDHRRATYPRSLGKPERTKEEWLGHADEIVKAWADFDVSSFFCSNSSSG